MVVAETTPCRAQYCGYRPRPPGRGNDIRHYPNRGGWQRPPCHSGQHPERQQRFDIGRESRRDHRPAEHHQPGEQHRSAAEVIGQGAHAEQGNRPCCEGHGGQLTRDRHRNLEIRRDFHQQRWNNEHRAQTRKNGQRKHGEKPRLVYLWTARLRRLHPDVAHPPRSNAVASPLSHLLNPRRGPCYQQASSSAGSPIVSSQGHSIFPNVIVSEAWQSRGRSMGSRRQRSHRTVTGGLGHLPADNNRMPLAPDGMTLTIIVIRYSIYSKCWGCWASPPTVTRWSGTEPSSTQEVKSGFSDYEAPSVAMHLSAPCR